MEVREPDARYLTAVQRTELGELPADWQVVRLSDIATVTSGKRLPLGESLTTRETPHPYIRVSDMGRGTVDATAIQFVPVNVFPKIQQYRIFSTEVGWEKWSPTDRVIYDLEDENGTTTEGVVRCPRKLATS